MTVLRISFALGRKTHALAPLAFVCVPNLKNHQERPKIRFNQPIVRHVSFLEVTKSIEIISNDKIDSKVANLKLTTPPDRPMVVLLTWLLAKRRHLLKYANFYLDQGFDVLNVACTPWQTLWPAKGIQLVAEDLLQFLSKNVTYQPLLIHGFSVGGYLWGEVLVKIAQDQERYKDLIDRIVGQVWDSTVDVTEISLGVPKAVFSRNPVMEKALRQYMMYHLKAFDKVATSHYVRASQMFHTNLVHAPALFFLSKTDPIGSVSANTRARESWESMGVKCYWKCWDKSPHVGHFQHHPKEYMAELSAFLERLNLVQYPEKIQARL